ncbi:hypothetical protein AXF42_Ash007620 [Apostasia shenzhenica]|uniref:Uncharacterized protein n=1 Tax=Apostasia shenzhenica TaxID=1088818 RepID=A0A2I0A5Z6_9ASPA|nr:hypothetical protein AXF42_Ash007620 [Apostasia shenzhenica]
MEDAREARRRRLAERKTDRLAFITGQSRTLDQPSPLDVVSPTFASRECIIASETPESPLGEDTVTTLSKRSIGRESVLSSDTSTIDESVSENMNPQEHTREHGNRVELNEINDSKLQDDITGKLFTTAILPKPAGHDGSATAHAISNRFYTIFTSKEISHSIISTANIRLLCAFVVALLVVLQHKGFMVGGKIMINVISFRPLLLVLLTNLATVFGRVLMNQGRYSRHEEGTRKGTQEEEGWSNGTEMVVKIGLVLQKALGAAFMDCSVCAVIMICGIQV